jgi:hypothetical protein
LIIYFRPLNSGAGENMVLKNSKNIRFSAFAASLLLSSMASAQEAEVLTAQPVAMAQDAVSKRATLTLPANSEILVRMNEEISTKKNNEGDTFYLTVVHDVIHKGFVVIPNGTRAVGELVWKTGKGAFGKSGKMDIEIKYLEMGGQRVPLIGKFRQEGEGNTVATVAAVALVWVAAPFITGKTGKMPAGRELTVHTRDPFQIAIPAGYTSPDIDVVAKPIEATPVTPAAALPAAAPVPVPAIVPAIATEAATTPTP